MQNMIDFLIQHLDILTVSSVVVVMFFYLVIRYFQYERYRNLEAYLLKKRSSLSAAKYRQLILRKIADLKIEMRRDRRKYKHVYKERYVPHQLLVSARSILYREKKNLPLNKKKYE